MPSKLNGPARSGAREALKNELCPRAAAAPELLLPKSAVAVAAQRTGAAQSGFEEAAAWHRIFKRTCLRSQGNMIGVGNNRTVD